MEIRRRLDISSESFEIDGRAFGLNGTYSVLVPDVISMLPGSSGSIGLNLTGIAPTCSSNSQFTCIPFPYNVTVSATGLPQGVSMTYSNQSVEVAMGASVVDVASIAALSANPGAYASSSTRRHTPTTGGTCVLSVWNGNGQWPMLPMLDVPTNNGDNQPIIVNGTTVLHLYCDPYSGLRGARRDEWEQGECRHGGSCQEPGIHRMVASEWSRWRRRRLGRERGQRQHSRHHRDSGCEPSRWPVHHGLQPQQQSALRCGRDRGQWKARCP